MQFTVCICTFDRPVLLKGTLQTLSQQTLSCERFEVIVVDNAGTEVTRQLAKAFNARYVHEIRIGLSHARNRAAREATTDWIIYLDDDIRAPTDLLERFNARIAHSNFAAVGGQFTHWFSTPPPAWMRKYYGEPMQPSSATTFTELPGHRYLYGCVMAVDKRALFKVGGFNSLLGMNGMDIGTGEEDDMQDKLRRAGYRIAYDPNITIEHLVQPYKYHLRKHVGLSYAHGRASAHMKPLPLMSALFHAIGVSLRITFYSLPFNLARLMFKRGYLWQHAYLDTVCKYAFELGKLRVTW